MKRCSTSLVNRKVHIKTNEMSLYTFYNVQKTQKKTEHPHISKDVEEMELLHIAGGNLE